MSKSKTIYVVTDGEYSDYSICAIFSTKKLADHYIKICGGCVEEWKLDDPEFINVVKSTAYFVTMDQDGNVHRKETWEDQQHSGASRGHGDVMNYEKMTSFSGTSFVSMDHAMKLAAEARQKWLREQAWPSK